MGVRLMEFLEYRGMSYEQASREAELLIKRAGWYMAFDRLMALYQIMKQHTLEHAQH